MGGFMRKRTAMALFSTRFRTDNGSYDMKRLGICLALVCFSLPLPALSEVSETDAYTESGWHYLLAALTGSDAARMVERKTGGKVLAVSEEERDGKRVYRVKVLLPEGRIRTLFIDRDSGAVRGS